MRPDLLERYALSFLGLPYRWGGENPVTGFDCSGMIVELLKAAGTITPDFDLSAQGIWNLGGARGWTMTRGFGALAFYGKSTAQLTHVGFCLDDVYMLEAGGGDRTTVNREAAGMQSAFVRIRPINFRKDFQGCMLPVYQPK